jgi:hypothetical protein
MNLRSGSSGTPLCSATSIRRSSAASGFSAMSFMWPHAGCIHSSQPERSTTDAAWP